MSRGCSTYARIHQSHEPSLQALDIPRCLSRRIGRPFLGDTSAGLAGIRQLGYLGRSGHCKLCQIYPCYTTSLDVHELEGEAGLWLADGHYKPMSGGERYGIIDAFLRVSEEDRSFSAARQSSLRLQRMLHAYHRVPRKASPYRALRPSSTHLPL